MMTASALALVAFLASLLAFFSVIPGALLPRRGPAWFRVAFPLRLAATVVAIAAGVGSIALHGSLLLLGMLPLALAWLVHPDRLFSVIDRPTAVPLAEARLADAAMVVGVAPAAGGARAYLLDTVARHHLINDVLEGKHVLVSYCPLCKSAVAYDATIDGRALSFVVGGFCRKNMLMRDRQTHTIWQQSTGEADAGPLAGRSLEMIGGELTTFGAWRADHPDSTVVVEPPPRALDYRRAIPLEWGFQRFAGSGFISRFPGRSGIDPRLGPAEEVAGIVVAGVARAYPLGLLRAATGQAIEDTLGGTRLTLSWDERARRVRATSEGRPLPVKRELWMSWSEFHPSTELFAPPPTSAASAS